MLRINPDNNCEIQKLDCDGIWQSWIDVSKCSASSTFDLQVIIGGINFGSGQPATDECHDYDLIHESTGITLIPVTMSTGDTIQFSDWKGAATDGFALPIIIPPPWYCASGQGYALNECHDDPGPAQTEDPFQDFAHMRAIFVINNVGYDAYNTTVTIPAGVTLEQGYVILNDHNLSDNSGTMQFHAKVCRSSDSFWSKTFDFSVNDGGWEFPSGFSYDAVWSSGDGWHTSAIGIFISKLMPANANITLFKCWYETDGPDHSADCDQEQFGLEDRTTGGGASQIFIVCDIADVEQTFMEQTFNYDIVAGQNLEIGCVNSGSSFWKIHKIELRGNGPNPFI